MGAKTMASHLERRQQRREMAKRIAEGHQIEVVAYDFDVNEATVRNACRESNVIIHTERAVIGSKSERSSPLQAVRLSLDFPT